MYLYIYTYAYRYTHVYIYVYIYIYMYIYIYICIYICTYLNIWIYPHVYGYIYVCIYPTITYVRLCLVSWILWMVSADSEISRWQDRRKVEVRFQQISNLWRRYNALLREHKEFPRKWRALLNKISTPCERRTSIRSFCGNRAALLRKLNLLLRSLFC